MLSLPHVSKTLSQKSLWSTIDEFGGVIVDDFLSPEVLQSMRGEMMPYVTEHRPGVREKDDFWQAFHGSATKRITGLAEKSKTWQQLLCDPLYKAMGDHYLGEDNYYLNTGQLICIGPNETPQMLHRDELNWAQAAGRTEELTITAIFALTDFTEQNGATVVVPGSHKWPGAAPEVKPEQTCQAVMKAGSALLYSGKIIHGGGANFSSDQWRVGLHAGFVAGWLRSEENHQLSTSLESAKTMPKHVQQLLGYRSYAPKLSGRLGLVDYEDAALLLAEDK